MIQEPTDICNGLFISLPGQSSTFQVNARGYWFTAPADFTITSLEVPTTASSGNQNIAVLRFNDNIPPPIFSSSTNNFTTLYLTQNNTSTNNITVCIPIKTGDVIGILGTRNDVNSYATGPVITSIAGFPVTLKRMGMQYRLSTTAPQDIWEEIGGAISRVVFEYCLEENLCVTPVELICPMNTEMTACQTQSAIDAQFADWLASASGTGGCDGVFTNNNTGAPAATGGSTTVTFTYTSTCAPVTTTCQASFTVSPPTLPCGWSTEPNGVNCSDGSGFSYNPASQIFTVTSTNCYYPNSFTSDALAFAQYDLCGNGSITTQVTSITGGLGWAGVTMRESNAAGAKKAQLMTNLGAFSRREFRTTTDAAAYPQQFPSQNRYWLRITRTGNQFAMFISPNGTSWYPAGSQNISMVNCIEVGLVVTNYTANSTVTANFANVNVTGGNITKPAFNTQEDILTAADFTIMPNPTTGIISLDLSSYGKRQVRLDMYNLQGKMLRSSTIETIKAKEEIDLTAFANGMYLIRVRAEGIPDVTKRVVLNSNR